MKVNHKKTVCISLNAYDSNENANLFTDIYCFNKQV